MKKICTIIGSVLILCAAAVNAADSPKGDESKIAALFERYLTAYFAGDTATLKKLEAPEFVVFNAGKSYTVEGRYDRIDQKVKEGTWLPGAKPTIESKTVRVIGDTSIVHGIGTVKAGDDTSVREAFTEVFVKKNGQWQLVHVQFEELK